MGHDTARGTRHAARGTRYTGAYRDPDGRTRSAGSFSTRRDALRAANREEQKVLAGAWHDNTQGDITFRDYVEKEWLPNKHVAASTRAAYISYLDKHFFPFFGDSRLNRISPSLVQDWVTQAKADGLSPRSIRKYHVFLSSVFVRAVKDRVPVYNPCDHTELPKVIAGKARTLTPGEYERLLAALPADHRLSSTPGAREPAWPIPRTSCRKCSWAAAWRFPVTSSHAAAAMPRATFA